MKLTAMLLLAVALLAQGIGATYFVAVTGNDTNPGTQEFPWRTIGKAATQMIPGDSALIRGGVYRESVSPSRSGTPGLPVTYARYDTETVTIEGAEVVTGWTLDSGNRYRALVGFTPSPRFTSVRDPNGNHGGLVLQDGAKLRYAMSASAAEVDSPGEYYMNDSLNPPCTLYVNVWDLGQGYDPNNYEMKVARIRKGFDLDGGEDYITVDGLTIRDVNDNAVHSIGSTDCIFRNLTPHSSFITGIYLTADSRNNLIEHCAFWDNGHGGIELASTRKTTVRKNRFLKRDLGDGCGGNGAHMWLGPVGLLADSNLIENNIAFQTGRYGYQGPFAAIAGSYNVIRHNSMVNGGGGAIALIDGGHNVLVNNACDMSAAFAHGIAVFPNAVRDSFQFIKGNCFYAQNPTDKYWWDNVRYSSLVQWESAAAQTGNIDSLPGFAHPDSEDLHLFGASACIDRGTQDSAAVEDYDGNLRPQGAGYDIGAFEYIGTGAAEGALPDARRVTPYDGPTIVRGVLELAPGKPGQTTTGQSLVFLLDISGRKVMALHPGPNDVSGLAPGVYFVRSAVSGERSEVRGRGEIRKVVIAR